MIDVSDRSFISKYRRDNFGMSGVEVVSGPTGRRTWPDEVKGRIVAESHAGDTSASEVARRHGIVPSQLFTWRRQARAGKLAVPVTDDDLFASVLLDDAPGSAPTPAATVSIEPEVGGVTLRLPPDASAARIAEIVAALRAAS